MKLHRSLMVATAAIVLTGTTQAFAQENLRLPRSKAVEIGRVTQTPDSVAQGEKIQFEVHGIKSSADIFDAVRVRRLDLVTLPPAKIIHIDAYVRPMIGAGITSPFTEKVDLGTLPPGEWTLIFNEDFGHGSRFERKLTVTVHEHPAPVTFQDVERGVMSAIRDTRSVVVRNARDWERLYREHEGPQFHMGLPQPVPSVDFDEEMVIARFQGGRSTGGYSTTITGITSRGDDLVVSINERSPGPNEMVTMALTSPFHIVRLRKFSGDVKFDITQQVGNGITPVPVKIDASSDIPAEGVADDEIILGLDGTLSPTQIFHDFRVRRVTRQGSTGGGGGRFPAPFTEEIIMIDALATETGRGALPRPFGRKLDVGPLDAGLYTLRFNAELGGADSFDRQLVVKDAVQTRNGLIQASSDVPRDAAAGEQVILGLDVALNAGEELVDFRVRKATRMGGSRPQPGGFVAPWTENQILVDALVRDSSDPDHAEARIDGRKLDVGPLDAGLYTVRLNASNGREDHINRRINVTETASRITLEILERTVVPETLASGEELVIKVEGLRPFGMDLDEVVVSQHQLEIFPPINVIQIDAYAKPSFRPGPFPQPRPFADGVQPDRRSIMPPITGWESEVRVSGLQQGDYQVRFNVEHGNSFTKRLTVGAPEALLFGTVEREGNRVYIATRLLNTRDGGDHRPMPPAFEPRLLVENADEETMRYLRLLDGRQVTVKSTPGTNSAAIDVQELVSPKAQLFFGTAGGDVRNPTLSVGRRMAYDVVGNAIRGAIAQFSGERVSVVAFPYGNELVGVSFDAHPNRGQRSVRVVDGPFPFAWGVDRLDADDIVSIEGSLRTPWFGRFFSVRYKKDGQVRTGWIDADDLQPWTGASTLSARNADEEDDDRSALGFSRALEGADDDE